MTDLHGHKEKTADLLSDSPSVLFENRVQIKDILNPRRRELAGGLLFLIGIITVFGLAGWSQSAVLAVWSNLWRQIMGWVAYPVFILLSLIGIGMIGQTFTKLPDIKLPRMIGFGLMMIALTAFLHRWTGDGLAGAFEGRGGGLFGYVLADPAYNFFGTILTTLFYLAVLLWGVALTLGMRWADVPMMLADLSIWLQEYAQKLETDIPVSPPARQFTDVDAVYEEGIGEDEVLSADSILEFDRDPERRRGNLKGVLRANPLAVTEPVVETPKPVAKPLARTRRSRRLPPITLLEYEEPQTLDEEEIAEKRDTIEDTLEDFGVPAKVIEVQQGPSVTQFGVEPGYIERKGKDGEIRRNKVRITQIANLRRDLALALAVTRLRIQAPVPGKGYVGVEVPNDNTYVVRMRSILESDGFKKKRASLMVALGQDVSGRSISTDLAKMPHLLIAGATGSGKSVCMNALVSCLVFNNTPEQLQLVMVDPKKVELIRFNSLPHLLGNVEVDGERVIGVLNWVTAEMDRRYTAFAQAGVKHLAGYNSKVGKIKDADPLPHIVVVIDELADLMMQYPADVERALCRLAQMARATGIHLIVATQRPSTDVITGLIKANFPARIAFAVASGTDSRVILDSTGAEELLGQGDMLFLGPDDGTPTRIQGCFLSDDEIDRITDHWLKEIPPPEEKQDAPWEHLIQRQSFIDDRDAMLEKAITFAQENDNISTSLLQRKLRVGYPRAARLMEHLFEMGLVENPKSGGKTRRSLAKDEEEDPLEVYIRTGRRPTKPKEDAEEAE